jgi:hypothetical protein
VSKLKLSQMGRRYLATLIKIWFERLLIADDVMVESARRTRSLTAAPATGSEPAAASAATASATAAASARVPRLSRE